MNWKNKKVLVTGSEGFIGSHLTERLLSLGTSVNCFIKYNFKNDWGFIEDFYDKYKTRIKIFYGDVRDLEAIKQASKNVDFVFHLAALIAVPYSYNNPIGNFQTNVIGTANVMTACLENNVKRIIHTSTSEVYGTPRKIPIKETNELQGQSPYSASKIGADKVAESFHYSYNLPVSIIRPFNTYGPRQSARAIIPTIISQALKDKEVVIGDTRPTRDFNYVEDVVRGFIKVAEVKNSIGTTINIGTGKEISIGDLTKKIVEIIGKDVSIKVDKRRFRPKESEVMRLCADITRAREILGWEPKVSLEEGLRRTIDWIYKNPDYYKIKVYNI